MAMVKLNVGCMTCCQPLGLNFFNIQSVENCFVKNALRKHFWFEEADFQMATICPSCWEQVDNFNRFYISVEQLYQSQINGEINVKHEAEADELVSFQEVLPECSSTNSETELLDMSTSVNEAESPKENNVSSERAEDEEPEYEKADFKIAKRKRLESSGRKIKNNRIQDECIRKHVKYNCEQCGEESETFRKFKFHARTCHANKSPFINCCGVNYSQRFALFRHVQFLTNPELFRCQECRKNFKDKKGYLNHMDMVHSTGSGDRIFKCDGCPKSFAIRYNLWCHMKNHVGWKCEECGEIFGNSPTLCKHVRQAHPGLPSYACDNCSKVFRLNSSLLRHKQSHEKQQCPLCQQMILKGKSMRKHVREVHPRSVVCKICNQRLRCRAVLHSHKHTVHGLKEPSHDETDSYNGVEPNSPNTALGQLHVENVQLHKNLRVVLHDCMEEGLPEGTGISTDIETEQLESSIVVKEELIIEESSEEIDQQDESLNEISDSDNLLIPDEIITKHAKYICANCGQESKTFKLFREHAQKVHDDRNPFVKCCGMIFRKRHLLSDHVQTLNNPNMFRCEDCQTNFAFKTSYVRHMRIVHKNQKFRWCPESYSSKQPLRNHKRGHLGDDNKKFVASQSDEDTEQEFDYKSAQLPHKRRSKELADRYSSNPDECIAKHVKYRCAKCGQESKTWKLFTKHARNVHGDRSALIECCGRTFRRRNLLLEHVLLLINPYTYSCEDCTKHFNYKQQYLRHMKDVHKNPLFKCDWCPQVMTSEELLTSHELGHLGNEKKKCPHCKKSYSRRRSLIRHLKLEHPDTPIFKCKLCAKKFPIKSWLRQHAMRHKKLQCLHCPQLYSTEKCLRAHVQHVHTGVELPMLCPICRDVLPTADALEAHRVRAHVQQFPDENDCQEEELPGFSNNTSDVQAEDLDKSIVAKDQQDIEEQVIEDNSNSECIDEMKQDDENDSELVVGQSRIPAKISRKRDMPDDYIKQHVNYLCKKCGHDSLTFKHFIDHASEVHGDGSAFVECCGKKFYKKFRLFEHVQTLKNPNAYHCEDCKRSFSMLDSYKRHVKTIHRSSYGCPHCEKTLPNKKCLFVHVFDMHREKGQPVVCTNCSKVLPSKEALEVHKAREHDDQNELPDEIDSLVDSQSEWSQNQLVSIIVKSETEVGGSEFLEGKQSGCSSDNSVETRVPTQMVNDSDSEQSNTKEEGQEHPNKRPTRKSLEEQFEDDELIKKHVRYICEHCGEESKTFFLLKGHVRDVHRMAAIISCCGKRYHQKSILLEHVQLVNNPDMFQCQHCLRQFTSKIMFQRHLRSLENSVTHVKKGIKCDHCDYVLPSRNSLDQHMQRWHAVAPEYTCDICSDVFHVEEWYLEHKQKHEPAGSVSCKFKCGLCSESFSEDYLHTSHMQDHEGWELDSWKNKFSGSPYYSCRVCSKVFRSHTMLNQHSLKHDKPILQCPDCPEKFEDEKLLLAHAKVLHQQAKTV